MPRPDDLGRAPLWELYVNRQAVQASLGRIPDHTLAFGVVVGGLRAQLRFQLTELTATNQTDIDDIVDDFDMLTGFILEVTPEVEVREQRQLSSSGPFVWWLYTARVPDETADDG
jgi:hypothetical protein